MMRPRACADYRPLLFWLYYCESRSAVLFLYTASTSDELDITCNNTVFASICHTSLSLHHLIIDRSPSLALIIATGIKSYCP